MRTRYFGAAMLWALCHAGPAFAQQEAAEVPDPSRNRVTVAVGPAITPSYIGSDDYVVLPNLLVQGKVAGISFETLGTSVDADLIPDRGGTGWKLQLGPVIGARLDRVGRVRDHAVSALGDLHTAWEVGGWAGIQKTGVVTSPYDTLSLSASWQHDIGNAHQSYVVSPNISYSTPLSYHAYTSLTFGADYVGRGFGAYYYDIDPAGSAASGLPAYSGADRAGWKDWNANFLLAHSVTGNLLHGMSVYGAVGYQRLLGRYARSPIVGIAGDPNQWSGSIGLAYSF